jgi:hypothetical protein
MGYILFKIAKGHVAIPFALGAPPVSSDEDAASRFCVSEGWVGDLSNGVIKLGHLSTMLHGLPSPECGLLNLLRCYDTYDRARILELFEQAATTSSSFCFSTTVVRPNGQRQPLFCIGESMGTEAKHSGSMTGVFLFPRFTLDAGSSAGSH